MGDFASVVGKEFDAGTFSVTREAIARYASAVGETNPLFYDEEAAGKTRYGGIIAPPTFYNSFPIVIGFGLEISYGLSYYAGQKCQLSQPMRPGDTISARGKIADVFEKTGRSGRMLFIVREVSYWNQRGEKVAVVETSSVQIKGRIRLKKSPESIASLSTGRSAPSTFDAVELGDEIGPLVKKPTREQVLDFMAVSGDRREGRPSRITSEEVAKRDGLEGTIVHPHMVAAFLSQMLTDWLPEGQIKNLDVSYRGQARHGDTLKCKGIVTGKYQTEEGNWLEGDLFVEAPHGRRPFVGRAIIKLDSLQ
jgi:acyl dehydratase